MVSWNQALRNIGFSVQAATNIKTEQGITLSDFVDLEESDIGTICQAIRKPGGEIRRRSTTIANPGISVSALAEKQLKLV